MPIPKIVHQIWRDTDIPERWAASVATVKHYHPDWTYELWPDDRAVAHVQARHPALFPVYQGLSRDIMRADVLRYVLMYDFGGMYCDLDFEFLRPWPYGDTPLLLSLERDRAYGDDSDQVANYFFASEPGHPLWRDIIAEVIARPPVVNAYPEIPDATGPGLVTRVFFAGQAGYALYQLTPRPTFSPHRTHARGERATLVNSGMTFGFHRGSGSWKERGSLTYLRSKLGKLVGR